MIRATSSRSPISVRTCSTFTDQLSTINSQLSAYGHGFQQPGDYLIRVDAVGLGLEVQQDAMAQHRPRDRANVVRRGHASAVEQRARLRAENERLPRARTRAPPHPPPH